MRHLHEQNFSTAQPPLQSGAFSGHPTQITHQTRSFAQRVWPFSQQLVVHSAFRYHYLPPSDLVITYMAIWSKSFMSDASSQEYDCDCIGLVAACLGQITIDIACCDHSCTECKIHCHSFFLRHLNPQRNTGHLHGEALH